MKSQRLFILGLIVHVIFLISIFDIYFKSPLVPNVAPVKNDVENSVERVVLISADGLRFDSLFDKDPDSGEDVAPYIQQTIRERGAWGVSQSHVPTESRPGHVAILAGFYEDPSAVTKGWKENPVDFDSIFNQSLCSFAWGSRDIIHIFYKGLNHNCAYSDSYEQEQNFAGDTMKYDNWVYDKVKLYFQDPKNNDILRKKNTFFFLHLLGQDTSGHADKPHSFKYRQNLRNVDNIVKGIEVIFNDFYKDDKTSFLFTSDHGMTDWGSHGAGDPTEIKTPFVAWAAGIKKLKSTLGVNIDQADITPLLAVLLGVPIPVNSIGVLPASYLNMSEKNIAKAMLLNAKQMSAQFEKKMSLVKEQSFPWLYSPFVKLSDGEFDLMIKSISLHIDNNEIAEALQKSKILIDICLEGLDYYHNYYQKPLLISITLSYLGWILYLVLEIMSDKDKLTLRKNSFLTLAFTSAVILTATVITAQSLPFLYYFYYLLPQFLWFLIFHKIRTLNYLLKKIKQVRYIIFSGLVLVGVEILVAGFFVRWILSISVGIMLIWSLSISQPKSNVIVTGLWIASGIILLIFPFVPISKGQPNPFLIFSSGSLLFLFSLFSTYYYLRKENCFLSGARCILIATSVWNSSFIHNHFNLHYELPGLNQTLSWCLFYLSLVSLFFGSSNVVERLQQVFMGLSVPFIFLSTNHECFFLLTLYLNLFCWIQIESAINNLQGKNLTNSDISPNSPIGISDFRRAYFFLSYISISFFGIGNIASMNSFDPAWVRCFLTTFSPFLMSSLILFKSAIPFLAVTCTMRALTVTLDLKSNRLFIIVLIYCNFMGLTFLYFVKNKGSWLDIGTSISHYVIQQVTIVFLLLLYGVAKYLMSVSLLHPKNDLEKKTENFFSLPSFTSKSKAHKS